MSSLIDWNLEPESWLIKQNIKAKQLLKNPLLEKDVWRTIEDLGLEINQHNKVLTVSFKAIKLDWFKFLVKLYILLRSQRQISSAHINHEVCYLSRFSQFLDYQSIINPGQINDQLFEDFEDHLRRLKLSEKTVMAYFLSLKTFFNLCRQEGWLNINTYWFKGKTRRLGAQTNKIDYIPEKVWQQLDEHLHYLPEPLQRIVLIIRATGLRIGEILNLSLDCLRQRDKQWRLRFLTEKYKVEDEIPICAELVTVIQEQQAYIRQHFGKRLFNSRRTAMEISLAT